MNRILFLTTEIPFPLDNGGKIRTYNLIKALSKEYKIDLLCFSEKYDNKFEVKALEEICENIDIVTKVFTNNSSKTRLFENIMKSIISTTPFIVKKFIDKQYKNLIEEKLKCNKYNAVVLDHLNICGYLEIVNKSNKVILSEHNCEFLILKRRYDEEKNIIKKLYLKSEYFKTKIFEKKVCGQVNKVIMLTEEDKRGIIDDKYDGENIDILPIIIENTYIKKNNNERIEKLLFLGTMSWYPNEQGIVWFLENVWNELKKKCPNIKLYIVGKNPSVKIKSFNSDNIIVTGYVDDVNYYIEECDVCIVPLFIGGGMRVKILECMAKKIPVISTTIGAEGIEVSDGENILIADTEYEFIKKINEISDSNIYNKIVKNAYEIYENNYSLSSLNKEISKIFN